MYALLRFIDDDVVYVCQVKHTKKTSGIIYKAKWVDGRYYPAKLIARNCCKFTLEQIKKNLELNSPTITLTSINTEQNCTNLKQSIPNKVNPTEMTKNIEVVDSLSSCSERLTLSTDALTFQHLINTHSNLPQNEYSNAVGDVLLNCQGLTDSSAVDDSVEGNTLGDNLPSTLTQFGSVSEELLLPVAKKVASFEEVQINTQENLSSIEFDFPELLNYQSITDSSEVDDLVEGNTLGDNLASTGTQFGPAAEELLLPVAAVAKKVASFQEVQINTQENLSSIEFDFPEFLNCQSITDYSEVDLVEGNTLGDNLPSTGTQFGPAAEELLLPVAEKVAILEQIQFNHEGSGSSTSVTLNTRKRKAVPLRYDRTVVIKPCVDTNTKDLSNLHVPTFEKANVRKYFCIYCKKLFRKFPQHLQVSHRNETAVKMYMNLPPNNAERKKIIETLRRRGDFEYNISDGCSELLVARRSQIDFPKSSKDYSPCPFCTAFFCRSTLRLHVKHCATIARKGERNVQILSRTILNSVHPSASELLKKNIFSILRNDDCVTVIRYDRLAVLYGNFLCSKYSSQHHQDMIRSKLRTIGRLIIAARSLDSTVTDFSNLLTPEKFDVTVAAIKQVGGINDMHTFYKSPTTVLNLSTTCKQASQVWKTTCIKDSNREGQQKVEDFLTLFNVAFPAELGRTAMENQVQHQRQKVVELPSLEDITKLVSFLRKNRRFWFSRVKSKDEVNLRYALKQLASFTLVSLMVFNRRRPGELERITINDFRTLKSADEVSAVAGHLTNDVERDMAKRYKRFEIRGKLNRTVPVLVNFEIEDCVNLIIERREDAGIPPENPYIFACRSVDHRHRYLRAYFLLRSYANQCGATKPNLLKATELRKHIATECALKDLSENVIHDVANFMGHNINIHNNIYRMPVDKRDIFRMSKILEMIQGGVENEDLTDEDEPINGETENLNGEYDNLNNQDENLNLQNQNIESDEGGDISYEPPNVTDVHSSSSEDEIVTKKKKGKHAKGLRRVCGPKKPWSVKEQHAAIKYFGKYLERKKLPSISVLCEELQVIDELKDRSPTSVKSWLQNQVVNRKTENDDSFFKKKRIRWSSDMKDRLSTVFADHLEHGTLPSKPECTAAIENYVEFVNLTPAALKTAVANEQHRKSKSKAGCSSSRQFVLW